MSSEAQKSKQASNAPANTAAATAEKNVNAPKDEVKNNASTQGDSSAKQSSDQASVPAKEAAQNAIKPSEKAESKTTNDTGSKDVSKTKKTAAKKTPAKAKASAKKSATPKKAAAKKSAAKTKTAEVKVKAGVKPGVQSTTTFSQKGSEASVSQKATAQAPQMPNYFKKMESFMPQQNFKFDQYAQEAANSSRESVEALIKSGSIFAKGMESMIKTAASLTQSAAEKQAQYAKELMSSKTLNEAAEKQSKIAQANFEEFVSNASKLSEMSVKLVNDSIEPLNSQMSKAMNKAKKAA